MEDLAAYLVGARDILRVRFGLFERDSRSMFEVADADMMINLRLKRPLFIYLFRVVGGAGNSRVRHDAPPFQDKKKEGGKKKGAERRFALLRVSLVLYLFTSLA